MLWYVWYIGQIQGQQCQNQDKLKRTLRAHCPLQQYLKQALISSHKKWTYIYIAVVPFTLFKKNTVDESLRGSGSLSTPGCISRSSPGFDTWIKPAAFNLSSPLAGQSQIGTQWTLERGCSFYLCTLMRQWSCLSSEYGQRDLQRFESLMLCFWSG